MASLYKLVFRCVDKSSVSGPPSNLKILQHISRKSRLLITLKMFEIYQLNRFVLYAVSMK